MDGLSVTQVVSDHVENVRHVGVYYLVGWAKFARKHNSGTYGESVRPPLHWLSYHGQ